MEICNMSNIVAGNGGVKVMVEERKHTPSSRALGIPPLTRGESYPYKSDKSRSEAKIPFLGMMNLMNLINLYIYFH